MFTGLVEEIGEIQSALTESGGRRLTIQGRLVMGGLTSGDSVAINGVCLTVEKINTAISTFQVFAMKETMRCSTVGSWRKGTRVNLERALQLSDRLGGHLVQGHVDGVGRIVSIRRNGASRCLTIEIPTELRQFVAEKGSIAIEGVSLTIGRVLSRGCEIHLIPETLKRTTLGHSLEGEKCNLEVDLMARYLLRFLDADKVSEKAVSRLRKGN